MSIKAKEFELSIDFKSTVPQSLEFMRADAISLKFDFGDYDDSGAAKMRVFAYMNAAHEYAFGAEFEKSGDEWVAEFLSEQTAGYSGAAVMTVQLLDADENQVNSANINLFLGESNSTSPFAPSQQFRDEILDAAESAEESKTAAEAAKDGALNAASAADAAKTAAEAAKTAAEASKAQAESSASAADAAKTAAEDFANSALAAKNAAEAAAEEAKAISDPDGLLQKHTAEIAALQAGKANIGEHFFEANSYLKTPSAGLLNGEVFSLCFFTDFDFSPQTADVWLPFSVGVGSSSGIFVKGGANNTLKVCYGYTIPRTYNFSAIKALAKNKYNAFVFIFPRASMPSLYVNGNLVTPVASGATPSAYPGEGGNIFFNSNFASSSQITASYLKVLAFNFDMSADDAPYTIADYAAGIAPTLLLKQGTLSTTDPTLGASTGSGWNVQDSSSSVVNGDWTKGANIPYLKNRTDDLPEGASYAVDILSKYFIGYNASNFYLFNNAQNFSAYNGKTIWLKINGWARKNTSDATSNNVSRALGFGFQSSLALSLYNSEFEQGVWTKFDKTVQYTMPSNGNGRLGIAAGDNSNSFTDYAWSLADVKVEVVGEALELADTRSAYQIKDLSGKGNHATIFGEVLSRKCEDPTTMQVEYTWGSGVSTGAYVMGDTETLPANAEIEVLAKASASATLSLGTSSSATTTFANAASVGTTTASIAKFYTGDAAQKLFATPSVAGLTINLTLKITSLK